MFYSEQLNWSQSHRDMMMMIQEMKRCLPEEKRSSNKPSTISALNYALQCVQQVQGTCGENLEEQQHGFNKCVWQQVALKECIPVILKRVNFLKHCGFVAIFFGKQSYYLSY